MADLPERRSPKPQRFVIGRPSSIPEGEHVIVTAGGQEIGIYHLGGRFYGLLNRCPHLAGPLCQGQVVTEVYAPAPGDVRGNHDRVFVTCPWHNWEFDIKTGQSYWNPKLRARPFAVAVEGGGAVAAAVEGGQAGRVAGPYMAETVPITIEDEYLVVNLSRAPLPPTVPPAAPAPADAAP